MKKQLCLILALVLMLSMAACGGSQEPDTTTEPVETKTVVTEMLQSNVVGTDEQTGETYYLLADFEDYYQCSQVKYGGDVGKMDMVSKADEPDMVTNGEGSVHITVSGRSSFQRLFKPYIRISTTGEFFNLTSDFSDMTRLTFDIYNCQDYEAQMMVYMNDSLNPSVDYPDFTFTNADNPNTIVTMVSLEPGWNHVEIPAEQFKIQSYDNSGSLVMLSGADALETVGAFCLSFDRGSLHETPEEFYLDNIRAYIAD